MGTNTKDIFEAALALSEKKRAALAEKLLDSLDSEESLLAGAKEADRRWQAYKRGEMGAKPVEEVIRALRKKKKS